ncbi:MAG: DegT/DnrJ/EryC1/StrS family aminotransferase [Kiritimatiellae bacterium]|jgi:perosamine synthetase|nr:DegT/DnrJ/EryC1/StrS family aminotransferase [Kiritimatiellia bacterium]MDD2348254.1 DegT/DnrJ/EryC1/StrS family aminotransferase [Kiritimatiellia bacterium]MDD3583357.1 DegT/DnrJ/EryC1/StrS family aminotransferase [Kiritimatiellia bacterium]HHU15580.1 DegT/DnrJ/EryC1/StrS family aminotransferase [Lentisphaerota bacterium]HON47425.1 DegT/DnrJ/EryC1/StrS family aminotransferase [Kiritimatiellia bacterium]
MVRRTFIKTAGLSAGAFWVRRPTHAAQSSGAGLPALLGGEKAYRGKWPTWPRWIPEHDEPGFLKCLRSGVWSRAATVTEFEKRWAEAVGAKRCLAVVNGTNALITALAQLGIGAGDEVILPPYTFIATAQAILMNGAIPVFCDIDPATYQIDPRRIESKITSRTRAILPVHILGLPADMAAITALAKKHGLYVVEDACQAWLAEVNGKKCGTLGNAGCYSFQNSKNLAIGEGGAIVSDDDAFMDRCHAYHNYGNAYGTAVGVVGAGTAMLGTKLRYTEYQAAMGLAQLKRLPAETALRHENAEYLKARLSKIPGIIPYRFSPGVTRAAFHLFPFRFDSEAFGGGLTRSTFLKALAAEGVPCSSGYTPLNKMPYVKHAFETKNFRRMYTAEELDYDAWLARNQCPENDRICQTLVWLPQHVLLADRAAMDRIADAVAKLHAHADKLAKA